MTDDEHKLEQVRKLVNLSERAVEEAERWKDSIEDIRIKQQATDIIESGGGLTFSPPCDTLHIP